MKLSFDIQVTHQTFVSSDGTRSTTNTQPVQHPLKRFKLLAEDTFSRSTPAARSTSSAFDSELQSYIACSQQSSQENGLQFWIERQAQYPLLAPLALDLLAAPASEAYVERVFSVCGDLTSGKRNRLTKGLEARAFLKMNIKYYDM